MEKESKGRVLKIDPDHPDPDHFLGAVRIISDGGVVAFPTETFYGLAADAANPAAIDKLFKIKKRPADHPVALIVHDRVLLGQLAEEIPETAEKLMAAFWPGPLTLLFQARGTIPSALTAGTGKIGIRIPSHPFALLLAEAFGKPLTATSANVSGEVEAVSAEDVRTIFEDSVDLILDGGPVPGAEGSTVVDMTYSPPRQVRKGRIAFSRVLEVLGFSVTEAHDW